MSRPWRDPASGVFYLRTRVPRALLPDVKGTTATLLVGDERVAVKVGDITKVSLRTRDPKEAKARHAAALVALDGHFAAVKAGPVRLSKRQITAIAGTIYHDLLGDLGDDPGETAIWDHVLNIHQNARAAGKLEQWVGPEVDAALAKLQIIAHPDSRAALIEEADRAMVQQALVLRRHSDGDFRPDADAARFPDLGSALPKISEASKIEPGKADVPRGGGLSIRDVWERFKVTEPKPASSTVRRWAPAIHAFDAVLGEGGMESVTPGTVTLFADDRVASGISPTSVSKVDVAAVKRMYSFAHMRGWIAQNPLAGLRRERRGTEVERDREGRDFKPAEIKAILRAASEIHANPGRRGKALLDAIRWVPWICAYSGARPGEAIQLRKEDFGEEEGIPYFFIRSSAGTVKTGKGRQTPLHRHLVDQGLLDFVRRADAGHLFLAVENGADPSAVEKAIALVRGRLGEWVRSIGVDDPEISPNHAWRHTFKTVAQDADLAEKVVDAICGHAPVSQGRKYGTVSLAAKAAALALFPDYLPTATSIAQQ